MPDAVNLGSIYAEVGLKLGQLSVGQAQVTKAVASIKGELAKLDGAQVGQKMASGLLPVGKALGGVAAGIALAGTSAVKLAADFQASMTKISNNTTMTASDIARMKDTVVALGRESGASFDDLAEGFAHITNFGYKAADATGILREAMRSAVATGTSTADTADILAKALHEFGLKTTDAARAMNVMHLAAAQGNMTLQQFDEAAGPAMAEAANLGVSLTDVSAAMSALTRHGLDASEAATQVKDILVHMISPSKSAHDELERLSKVTGIDLVGDFSLAGLKAKGFTGVMDDLTRATHGNGQEIYKLIQAQRGGLGAMILAGNGAQDYKDILQQLNDAMAGKIDPTTQAYNRSIKGLNNEIARVSNEIKSDFIPVGEKLIPVFEDAIPLIRDTAKLSGQLLDAFTKLPKPIQEATLALGGFVLGIRALNLGLGIAGGEGLIGGLGKVAEKLGLKLTAGTLGGLLMRGGAIALPFAGLAAVGGGLGAQQQGWIDDANKRFYANTPGSGHVGTADTSARAQIQRNLAQAGINRDEAKRILGSPEYKQILAEVEQYKGQPKMEAFALQAKAKYEDDVRKLLADATKLTADAHKMRASEATGDNFLAEAMAKHIGEATGVQCGAAVTKALKEAGIGKSATQLARAAVGDPKKRLHPDAAGNFPPGTIIFFPGKGGAIGSDPTEHFGIAGGVGPNGQVLLESTTAGGKGRHYRGDRTWQQVATQHGGNYFAFSPGSVPVGSGHGTGAGGSGGASDDDARNALRNRQDYQYEAGQIGAAQYVKDLQQRLVGLKKWSDDYKSVMDQIRQVEQDVERQHKEHLDRMKQMAQKATADRKKAEATAAKEATAAEKDAFTDIANAFGVSLKAGEDYMKSFAKGVKSQNAAVTDAVQSVMDDANAVISRAMDRKKLIARAEGAEGSFSGNSALDAVLHPAPTKAKQGNTRNSFSWIGDEMGHSLDEGTRHFHSFTSFFKEQVQTLKNIWKQALLQMAEQWALLQLTGSSGKGLGGIFGKQVQSFGGQNPLTAIAGLFGGGSAASPGDPGMGGSAGGGIGGVGGLAGLLGKGGGFLGSVGNALPWIAGGLALNGLLGNPVGKLFKGIGKIFHFSGGGVVPGVGHTDSVPAMLTPGEHVFNQGQIKAMGGHVTNINIAHHGNNYGAGDVDSMHSDWAWQIKQQLPVATPGT